MITYLALFLLGLFLLYTFSNRFSGALAEVLSHSPSNQKTQIQELFLLSLVTLQSATERLTSKR